MTTPTAPLSTLGHVDPAWRYALGDILEHIPDLQPHLAPFTYSQMRQDPQLAAILAAYTLPIRRATWAVDPAGCRPEVAQLVADDLGLPVLGDDTPGPARLHGVSWAEHLRMALHHLTYGAYGFEIVARLDEVTGLARLAALYERVPTTVSNIHLNEQGEMLGISQDSRAWDDPAQIPADRLLWYVHGKEGSNWFGHSLLRPAFGCFIVKRECIRTLATSSRRFGMGVPTVEWANGATPTPGQQEAAQQAASAARVGDQSGLALPPGATLVLKGLTGGAPDTLAFLRYLDQQMSRMTLTGFLDLAETTHGSRALGTAFIDLFTLSLAALGEQISDTVTRQCVARIVGWNWQNEPVPRVVVTDVGTKHEFTAQAIQQLMQVGAIQADPALDAYIRQAYQLPARSTPWTPPAPKGAVGRQAPVAPVADAQPVAAAAKPRARARRAQAAGQTALPIAAAAGDDPAGADQFQQDWVQSKADVLAAAPVLLAPLVDDLATQVEDHLTAGDVAALATIAVSAELVASLAAALLEAMNPLSVLAAGVVVAGAAGQGKKIKAPDAPGVDANAQFAEVTAQLVASGYASSAARKALALAGPGADPAAVAAAVRVHLDELATTGTGWVADNVGAALSAAQNAGRRAVMEAHPPKRIRAVETLDTNTCSVCEHLDQNVYQTLAEALVDYPVIGAANCLGGSRCRGFLHPEW